jgi:ABC-type uncharacterized transport system permease subunit
MDAPVIRLDAVTRRIGDCVAVDAADATLSPGEIHAVIGENGAGKTTLLKLAAGVVAPTGGRVLVGERPLARSRATPITLRLALAGTWGTAYGIGQVLFKSTPLIFTALAFEVAMRSGLFNIGAEGQVALGSLAGGGGGAHLPASTPWPVAVTVCVAAAALTGAGVALIPALMRARLGVHEIISTIMLNRIVEVLLPFVLVTVLGAATLRTASVVPGAALLKLDRLFPDLRGSAASVAFPLAVALAFGVDALLRRSRRGREMRWACPTAGASSPSPRSSSRAGAPSAPSSPAWPSAPSRPCKSSFKTRRSAAPGLI